MKNMKMVTDCLDQLRFSYKKESLEFNKEMASYFAKEGVEYDSREFVDILVSCRTTCGTKETVFIQVPYESHGYFVTTVYGGAKSIGPGEKFKSDTYKTMLEANTGAQLGKWCLGTEENWGFDALIYIVRLYSRKQKNFRMDAKLVKRSLIEVTEAVASLKSKLDMRPAKKRGKS